MADNKDNKSSVLKEAIAEFKEIKDAADRNAKAKLANEFPEKFDALLKEELKKNNKESDNKTDNINESTMKKDDKVTKKETKKPLNEDLTNSPMSEVEQAYDGAGQEDQFNISLDEIEKEISDMEAASQKMPTDALPHGTSDEYEELKRLYEEMGAILNSHQQEEGSVPPQGVEGQEQAPAQQEPSIDQLKEAGEWQKVAEIYESMIGGETGISEDVVPEGLPRMVKQTDKSPLVVEEEQLGEDNVPEGLPRMLGKKSGPDTKNYPKGKEAAQPQQVDEILSQSLSANKQVSGNQTPRAEGAASFKKPKLRYALQTEAVQAKFNKLLEENKKVIKNLNEVKTSFKKANTLVEGYKTALEKYRKQLSEMAVFNTNLANVNSLLVNEALALTSDDKISIINEFKKINSITESKKKYGEILSEMKEGKKTISEGVEEKVAVSVQPSSKQKLDEVTEKTAYQDNAHLSKIKHMMNELDKRGKKNNI